MVVEEPENDFWAIFRIPVTTTLSISLTEGSMRTLMRSSSRTSCLPFWKMVMSCDFMPTNEKVSVMFGVRRALRMNFPSGPVTAPRLALLSRTLTPASGRPFSSYTTPEN